MVEVPQSPVRERILDAAMSLLADRKAKKIAQPQVARLAGVPQGHLTYYFPKKLDLLVAVAERYEQAIRVEMAWLFEGPPWPQRDVAQRDEAMDQILRLITDLERTRMLMRLLVEADADPRMAAIQKTTTVFIRTGLARLMSRPEDDADIDLSLGVFWGLALQHMLLERTEAETAKALGRMRAWMDAEWTGDASEEGST